MRHHMHASRLQARVLPWLCPHVISRQHPRYHVAVSTARLAPLLTVAARPCLAYSSQHDGVTEPSSTSLRDLGGLWEGATGQVSSRHQLLSLTAACGWAHLTAQHPLNSAPARLALQAYMAPEEAVADTQAACCCLRFPSAGGQHRHQVCACQHPTSAAPTAGFTWAPVP